MKKDYKSTADEVIKSFVEYHNTQTDVDPVPGDNHVEIRCNFTFQGQHYGGCHYVSVDVNGSLVEILD